MASARNHFINMGLAVFWGGGGDARRVLVGQGLVPYSRVGEIGDGRGDQEGVS